MRLRTMVNVWGDCVGAGVVATLSHKELQCQTDAYREMELAKIQTGENDTPQDTIKYIHALKEL